jgi:spiro-SPASM protein
MKCIATVDVDCERTAIGTQSRLSTEIEGQTVLARTLGNLAGSSRIADVFVLCPPDQADRCRAMIPTELKSRVKVQPNRMEVDPFRHLVRTSRKWSLDSWRGGLGGTCCMDEYTRSDEVALLASAEQADYVFCAPAAAPLIDPVLADTMIAHAETFATEARMAFSQTPPGLAGAVFTTSLLVEMGRQHVPPGFVMSYKPDQPAMDLAHKSCCFTAPESVRYAVGRLITDTDRSLRRVAEYLKTNTSHDAEAIGRWLIDRERREVPDLPREVEIELTTDDHLPQMSLRPRGDRVPNRGPIDLAIIERIATEMSAFDDSLVVLGGFGEPTLHPQFDEIVAIFRKAGIYGIAVRTSGLALSDRHIATLIDCQVDVVSVLLDAWTPQLYAQVQGQDRHAEVMANLDKLSQTRSARECVAPLIVPEIVKAVETMDELEPFFDGWIRKEGWATITGFSHHAGQLDDRSVMNMSPPTRIPCTRISQRATILADGAMLVCDQDFAGKHAVGNLNDASLSALWLGTQMQNARQSHQQGTFQASPLCAKCDEWHRP